jgi:hypothetical protein
MTSGIDAAQAVISEKLSPENQTLSQPASRLLLVGTVELGYLSKTSAAAGRFTES